MLQALFGKRAPLKSIPEAPTSSGATPFQHAFRLAQKRSVICENCSNDPSLIQELSACDLVVSYTPSKQAPGAEHSMAANLEKILQGAKTDKDAFYDLFKNGFVFKETGGKWGITDAGKQLVERHKLIVESQCLVCGVQCVKGWKGDWPKTNT